MDYFLKQIEPGNPYPLRISLHEDEMKIGRSTVTSLNRYSKVSRYHASFTKQNDSWYITDLKSLNCLYVNFERIQHTVQLNVGDIIGLGSPNISQDGGFVCILAVRNKVIVKQEPPDNECAEILTDSTNILSKNSGFGSNEPINECISKQQSYNRTDDCKVSNDDSGPTNLRAISSVHPDFNKCKTDSALNLDQNININLKFPAETVQPTLNSPETITKEDSNINRFKLGTEYVTQHIDENSFSNTSVYTNSLGEYVNVCYSAKSDEKISNSVEHKDAPNCVHSIPINTLSSLICAYPGIEYLEGLEEFKYCEIIAREATSKDIDLEKCDSSTSALSNFHPVQDSVKKAHLNPVKQDYITDLSDNSKVKKKELKIIQGVSHNCTNSAEIQKCESIGDLDVKKTTVINEQLSSDWPVTSSDQTYNIRQSNDIVKSKNGSDYISSVPSQTLNTSLAGTTSKVDNAINILSSQDDTNLKKNFKEKISHSKDYLKEINESTKAVSTEQFKHHTLQQNNKFAIDNEVNLTKTTLLKTSTLSNLKTRENNDCLPKIVQNSKPPSKPDKAPIVSHFVRTKRRYSVSDYSDEYSRSRSPSANEKRSQETKSKCETKFNSKNSRISLKAGETYFSGKYTSKKDKLCENSPELSSVENSIEESSMLRNTTSQPKRNNLTVAIDLKVRKNKILSSESDCEEGNEPVYSSPKSFAAASTKQKIQKQKKVNHVCKRAKTGKTNDGEFCSSSYSEITYSPFNVSNETNKADKVPIVSHFVRTKRLYSGSDYSDEYSRSRSPSDHEKRPQETKSKSLRRTLLIDSKPMEYRSRKLRGREEWFKERTVSINNKNVTQTSKDKSSRQEKFYSKKSNKKSREAFNSFIEYSTKLKSKIPSKKRKEKIKSNEVHSQELIDSSQTIEKKSQKKTENDSVRKRAVPPVPRRKNNFCSRMGFLLDTQVDKKSINNDKQREELTTAKQDPPKHRGTVSSDSKLQLSLELEFSANKKQPPTFETTPVKHNFTKTSTNSKIESSVTVAQHSISKLEEHTKILTNKSVSENWIPILELDCKRKYDAQSKTCLESNMSDKVSDSIMLKKTRETFNLNGINCFPAHYKKVTVSPSQQTAKGTSKSRRNARIIKHFHISSTLLMEMIVSWNPKWLVEQKTNKNPPPLIAQGASFLNLSFSSYESYASSYFPMIVLEVWECLFRDCSKHLVLEQLGEDCNNFFYTVKKWENNRRLTELKCESVVSDTLCYYPTEGKIVLLNIKERQESGLENYTFGCIRRHSMEQFKPGSPEWNTIPAEQLNNAKLVKFEVVVKKSKKPIQMKSVYLAHGLSNINRKLKLVDALRSFRYSLLSKYIYHPREETLMFCDSSRETLSYDNINQAITEEVQNPMSKAKLIMLQAPPGTGKTKCVAELIMKLAFRNSTKSKVLVCAPSYSSLDEILCGLVHSNENCSNSPYIMKIVRLGEDKGIYSNLKEYSLTSKVEKLYKEDCVKKMYSRECALKLLEEKINNILFKQQTSQDMYTKVNKNSTLQALVKKMQTLKNTNLLHHMDERCRKGYECIILQESDVLLTTLECSILPAVRTFLKGESMAYCIVDEAAQCNELQLLQCLHHEQIGKLVLFGDPQQQKPATVSKYAAKCGFDRSIFDRFFLHFKKKFHKIPSLAFKEQYRMHSEICQFPSKYFYDRELTTAEGTDEKYANFPLKPYTVLDVLEPGPIPDDTESSLIVYICSLLIQACPKATIGVIVAEEDQKRGLSLPCDPEYSTVEVNTLERFKGREKDIVLIPCIRQSPTSDGESIISCGNMLNVALTRAKQCLIICGQIASNVEYPHWRALFDDALLRNNYLCVASVTHLPLVFANYIKKV